MINWHTRTVVLVCLLVITVVFSMMGFTEYAPPNVTSNWNGDGILPYMDYVHSGIERLNLSSMTRNIFFPIYSVKARTMDVNFTACFSDRIGDQTDSLYIWKGLRWDFPHVTGYYLYLPGGTSFDLLKLLGSFPHNSQTKNITLDRFCGGQRVYFKFNENWKLVKIVLKDGSYIDLTNYGYYDTKGNWIKYYFGTFGGYTRISTLKDSVGHTFNFDYDVNGDLSKMEQMVQGYPNKTILERQGNTFVDAVGRRTTFDINNGTTFMGLLGVVLNSVTYPNGVRSVYESQGLYAAQHKWYKPGESNPFRVENYSGMMNRSVGFGDYLYKLDYTDGLRKKVYYFTDPGNAGGYTAKEETYEYHNGTVGRLLKQVKTDYYFKSAYSIQWAVPSKVTTYYTKKDGTLGSGSAFSYEYDDQYNVTRIIDPYGTETRMAYANTNSNKNLTQYPQYPISIYSNVTQKSFTQYGDSFSRVVSIGSKGGKVAFSWKGFNNSIQFVFKVDGKSKASTTANAWQNIGFSLSPGSHTLSWTFTANVWPVPQFSCYLKDIQVYNYQYLYQNALYTTGVGYDKLLTKATMVKDPVHNTIQLHQTHYKYDAKGNLIQSREAYNGSFINTYYTYDTYGNVLSKTDGNGNQLQFEYTSNPNTGSPAVYLSKVKRVDGTVVATYDEFDPALDKPRKVTDPKGNIFRYRYDELGRLLEEKLDDSIVGITRKLEYDDSHSITTMRYGNGNNWQVGLFTFDPIFGKLQKIERQRNDSTWQLIKENHFDIDGRVDWSRDNMQHKVQHDYDSLDREIQTISPTGNITQYDWDDRTLTITDANNHQQVKKFDLLDRLKTVMEYPKAGETITTAYQYDNYFDSEAKEPHSNLVSMTNGCNASTTYTYDNFSRLTRVDYPQDGPNPLAPETYTYDNVGNLLTKIGARGTKTIEYEFFAGYRVKKITEPDGQIVENQYDANDNLTNQTSSGAVYNYHYDAQNRVDKLNVQLDSNTFAFSYHYDDFGRMDSITYPGRTQPITYKYDELDRLDRLNPIPGFVTGCTYDDDNKMTEMTLANGLRNTYAYDGEDRPDKIKSGNMGDLVDLRYTYDPVGNVSKINGDNYEYDGLNRLTWAGNLPSADVIAGKAWGRGMAWAYDAAGNMTSRSVYGNGQLQNNTTFTYDLANRLWSMGSTTYGNDAAGARTSKNDGTNSWTYTYDGESRMTRVTNGSNIEDNTYDGAGMRVKKVNNGKITYYVYSGANPILEYSANDGKYTYYIFAGDKSIAEEKDGKKVFYHRDHLGSTRALTDQDRKLVGLCKYDPWGNLESTNEYDEGVLNGNFELTDKDGVINWTAINDSLISKDCTYDPTNGINGSAALRINRQTTTDSWWARKNLFVSPDTDYVLSGYFRSDSVETRNAKAQIVYYDQDGGIIRIDDSGALGYSGTWKEFTLTSHAPADAATMEIRLTTEDAQGASVLFDGIRLKVPGLEGKYDFTGKKEDEGTGLKYFGARFYDPETGRFTTADTYTNLPNDERGLENLNKLDKIIDNGLDKPIEQNPYVYCSDNPVGHFDSDGHMGREIAQAGQSLEAAGPYGAVAASVIMGIGAVVMLVEIAIEGNRSREASKTQSYSLPMKGKPNTVAKKYGKDGKVVQERHYDDEGNPDYDIDFTDHGTPTKHDNPHKHKWRDGERQPAEPVGNGSEGSGNESGSNSTGNSGSSNSNSGSDK